MRDKTDWALDPACGWLQPWGQLCVGSWQWERDSGQLHPEELTVTGDTRERVRSNPGSYSTWAAA